MKLGAIIPELILGGLCLGLVPVAGLVNEKWKFLPAILGAVGLAAALAITLAMVGQQQLSVFRGTYAVDGLGHLSKILILLASLISLLLMIGYFRFGQLLPHATVALVFSTLGAVGLSSSMDLGLIVLFLQLMSMSSYVLVALVRTDTLALEASIKYFIYGAVALALMAYGLSFLYGLTGSLNLKTIGMRLSEQSTIWIVVVFTLVLVGYGFEISLVPFHSWLPDTASGATSPVAGWITVGPKIAGFMGLIRFLTYALPPEMFNWPFILSIFSALTMTVGNLLALQQTSLKRLLAYSSIAHAGYLSMALVALGEFPREAITVIGFYLFAYTFMNLGAFSASALLEKHLKSDRFDAVRGLYTRSLPASLLLSLSLLSLAGIPPLVGFIGKVLLLQEVFRVQFYWLTIVAVANMTLALFYYVRVVALMYLNPPVGEGRLTLNAWEWYGPVICVAATFVFGILPNLFLGYSEPLSVLLPRNPIRISVH